MADATAAPAAPAAASGSTPSTNQTPKPTSHATNGAQGQTQQPAQTPPAQGGIAQAKAKLEGQRPAAPKAAPAPTADWGDDQETQLWELIKKAPHFKVKAGGREIAIDSKEAWEKHGKRSIERVQGIHALTEEAKKQFETSKATEAKYAELEAVLNAARQGDEAAVRALGIVHPFERQEQLKTLEEMPPQVRAVLEENERLHAREVQRQKTEAAAQHKAQQERVLAEARGLAGDIAGALADADGNIDPDLLFHAVAHMDVMHRAGQRLGVTYTAEDVRDYARERYEAGGIQRTLAMGPEKMMPHVAPVLAQAGFEALVAHLPEDQAKAFAQQASRWLIRLHRGGTAASAPPSPLAPQPPVVGQTMKLPPAQPNGKQPLPALRFGRR